MAIRMTGMVSGLDTDSIVKELVSAYSTKKEKYEKEQTKLGWKQEIWKSLNKEVNSFYKSYHMLVTVPIFLSDRVVDTKVEIQIRTMAMDFWASLEHKIYYKFEGNAPQYISRDLRECSEIVSMLDAKMLQLNEAIIEARAAQEEDTDAV